MNHISRRGLLAATALAPVAVAGCATTPAQFITDIQSAVVAFQTVAPAIAAISNSPTVTTIIADIGKAGALVGDLAGAVSATAATSSTVGSILSLLQAAAPLIQMVPGIPAIAVTVVEAFLSVAPSIAAAIGLSSVGTTPPLYTPAKGRAILAAIAGTAG